MTLFETNNSNEARLGFGAGLSAAKVLVIIYLTQGRLFGIILV
jgi:hypothetical protein